MNELLAQIFGSQPSYAGQLLGEDEARRLQQQAQQSGLLNVGLALLSGAGPSTQRRGVGELLAQGVMAGQQAYQGAYNKALQEQALKEQIAERQQLRREQMAAQQLLPQIIRPGGPVVNYYGKQTGFALRDDEGNIMPGAGMGVSAPQLDMNVLTRLLTTAPSVAGKVLPTVEAFRKLTAPEEFDLAEGAQRFRRDPVTGQVTPIAGAPKVKQPPGAFGQAMLALGLSGPSENLTPAQLQQVRTEMDRQAKAGATNVTVPVNTGKTFGAEMAKSIADSVQNTFNQATAASDTLGTIETLKPILKQGDVFSGPLANQQILLARIGTSLGIAGQDTQQRAQNTVVAMQQLAGLELQAAAAMKGQGAITENERSLIARAAGGDLTKFTANEVQSLLGALEKTAKFKIQAHQRNINTLRKKPEFQDLIDLYELPARTIPLSAL